MKILILTDSWPPNSLGGADRVAFWQAQGLLRRGFEVLVITTTRDKKIEGDDFYEGIRIKRLYSSYHERWRAYVSLYNPRVVKKVKKIIEDFKPDIVHAHNIHFYLSYACLEVAKKFGAKVFITAHDVMSFCYGKLKLERYLKPNVKELRDTFDYRVGFWDRFRMAKFKFNPFREILVKRYLKYTDNIFTVSLALQEALRQNGIKNTQVLYNGIDVKDFEIDINKIEEFRKKKGLTGKKVVLFGGRISEAKGIGQIREAMEIVRRNLPGTVLLVFGGDFKEEGMKSLGWIQGDDLKLAYAVSEVVVVPSVCFDSLPTVVLEAMASKKTVIATQFGGSREMVDGGKTGYVVNPFNIKDMADKILRILNDKSLSKELGENGYKRVVKEFNLDKNIDQLLFRCNKK